jgi:hypothetical protein
MNILALEEIIPRGISISQHRGDNYHSSWLKAQVETNFSRAEIWHDLYGRYKSVPSHLCHSFKS